MIKKLFGLIMLLAIGVSCSKDNKNKGFIENRKPTSFFKNDTITSILDIIISENKKVKSLNINLIDEKEQTLLMFKETDSIYNCDNFGGIYYYKNIRFFLSDYSERINFDKIIDGQLNLDSCEYYLAKYHSIIDTEEYVYEIDKNGKVYYPNGQKLIYKDSIIQLKFWRENR